MVFIAECRLSNEFKNLSFPYVFVSTFCMWRTNFWRHSLYFNLLRW